MDGLGRKVVYFAAPASRDIGAAAEALGEVFFVREAFSPLPFVCVPPEKYLADYAARQAGSPAEEAFDEEDILVVAEGTLSPSDALEGWRLDLVARHLVAQGGVHALVARNQALAFKLGRNDDGIPMAAIALQGDVVARQVGTDGVFDVVGGHNKQSRAGSKPREAPSHGPAHTP